MQKTVKAQRICAKLQLRAYRRKWTETDKKRWDKMIKIILKERQR